MLVELQNYILLSKQLFKPLTKQELLAAGEAVVISFVHFHLEKDFDS